MDIQNDQHRWQRSDKWFWYALVAWGVSSCGWFGEFLEMFLQFPTQLIFHGRTIAYLWEHLLERGKEHGIWMHMEVSVLSWGYPQFSSILDGDFPWKKPSSELGGYPHWWTHTWIIQITCLEGVRGGPGGWLQMLHYVQMCIYIYNYIYIWHMHIYIIILIIKYNIYIYNYIHYTHIHMRMYICMFMYVL